MRVEAVLGVLVVDLVVGEQGRALAFVLGLLDSVGVEIEEKRLFGGFEVS